jgi:hypothetical protein
MKIWVYSLFEDTEDSSLNLKLTIIGTLMTLFGMPISVQKVMTGYFIKNFVHAQIVCTIS